MAELDDNAWIGLMFSSRENGGNLPIILYHFCPETGKHVVKSVGPDGTEDQEFDSPGGAINALCKYRGIMEADQLIGWLSKFPAA